MKKKSFIWTVILLGCLLIAFPAILLGAPDETNAPLAERVNRIEERLDENNGGQHWADRISISRVIEGEAGLSDNNFDNPAEKDTVELGLDADLHEHVSGHVSILWEEDDTDPLDMDEGFITLDGKDKLHVYLKAGKFYLPFGNFESHMITDPVTLELGETNQSAVQIGHSNNWIDASIALFNGDVNESNDETSTITAQLAIEF